MNNLADTFDPVDLIPTGIKSNTDGRAMIYYQGKYHILYSDRNGNIHLMSEKSDTDNRSMYIARER